MHSLNFAAAHWDCDTPPEELVDPDVVEQVKDAVRSVDGWTNWNYQENFVVASRQPSPNQLPNTLRIRRAVFNALISAMDHEIDRLLDEYLPSEKSYPDVLEV